MASWKEVATTDGTSAVLLDSSNLEVGTYYIATAGFDGAYQTVPAVFVLTVEKNEEDTKPTDPVTPVEPVIPSEPTKPTTSTEPTEPETPVAGMNFSDVSTGDWFYEDVAYVYAVGLMNGMGNGRFGPNDPIPREQMAVILCRYAQYKKLDVSVSEDTNMMLQHLLDIQLFLKRLTHTAKGLPKWKPLLLVVNKQCFSFQKVMSTASLFAANYHPQKSGSMSIVGVEIEPKSIIRFSESICFNPDHLAS